MKYIDQHPKISDSNNDVIKKIIVTEKKQIQNNDPRNNLSKHQERLRQKYYEQKNNQNKNSEGRN